MAEVVYYPCKQGHIKYIMAQDGQDQYKRAYLRPEFAVLFEQNFCLSAWVNGACVAAGGLFTIYPGRSLGWALVGRDAGRYMLPITRKCLEVLKGLPCGRVEMTVGYRNSEAHKWAQLLGFKCEAPRMEKYGVFGEDESLYARVK